MVYILKTINGLKTKFIGKRIEYYDILESTHLYAKNLPNESIKNGMIIWTKYQTNGIGTHNRKWITEKNVNALTFEIILTPNCDVKKIENLTTIVANSLKDSLYEMYKIKTTIKEPNDIMINGKKMAGILTEAKTQGNTVKKIFIGIGINIKQESFPDEIKDIATSIKLETGKEISQIDLLKNFFEIFEKEYLKILG